LREDLFGHPILPHSLQVTQPTYLCPFIHFTIFSPLLISSSSRGYSIHSILNKSIVERTVW
jgi:hypothetical protein